MGVIQRFSSFLRFYSSFGPFAKKAFTIRVLFQFFVQAYEKRKVKNGLEEKWRIYTYHANKRHDMTFFYFNRNIMTYNETYEQHHLPETKRIQLKYEKSG